jgi:hypothetical protein
LDEKVAPIDGTDAPTEESGKTTDAQSNEDRTVAGLSRRLNKELAEKASLAKQLAELVGSPSDDTEDKRTKLSKLERENAALRLGIKYPDVAGVIDGAIRKGLDPSWIDEDFVATLRSANTQVEDDSPAHNPARVAATNDQSILKGLKSLWED